MGGLFWPLVADHLCAQQSPRARIHAVAQADLRGRLRHLRGDEWLRTVCGLDAQLLVHGAIIGGEPSGDGVIASWPAPKAERCTDCAAATGIRGQVAGSSSFAVLVPLG